MNAVFAPDFPKIGSYFIVKIAKFWCGYADIYLVYIPYFIIEIVHDIIDCFWMPSGHPKDIAKFISGKKAAEAALIDTENR